MTVLAAHYRGDTFGTEDMPRQFTLGNGWVGSDFEDVWMTFRTTIPGSSTVTDDDAVDQASVLGGEITFVGALGSVVIPAARTTAWPAPKTLYYDVQAEKLNGEIVTIDSGTIPILADITRST